MVTITLTEVELLSFLHQNIIGKLCEESAQTGLPHTNIRVITAVLVYFNFGPSPHQIFDNLMQQLATSF